MKKRDITNAMKKTIAKHKNPIGERFFSPSSCYLCLLPIACSSCIYAGDCSKIQRIYAGTFAPYEYMCKDEEQVKAIRASVPVLERHLYIIQRTPQASLEFKDWMKIVQQKIAKALDNDTNIPL